MLGHPDKVLHVVGAICRTLLARRVARALGGTVGSHDVQSTYGFTVADDMPSSDAVFDTEEFDRVYAAYADSKCQLNQMRVSRGFFPVVAFTDGGQRIQVNASGSNSP